VHGLESLEARKEKATVPDYYLAVAWMAAGNAGKAQAALVRAYDARSNWMIYLQYDPRFDGLRRNTSFQVLVRQISSPREHHRATPAEENLARLRPQPS
jgi:hypothetical protein